MSVCDVQVPQTKFSLIEWRKPNDRPKENDRVLINVGSDVLAARFVNGAYFANNWSRAENIIGWAEWPKAPVA